MSAASAAAQLSSPRTLVPICAAGARAAAAALSFARGPSTTEQPAVAHSRASPEPRSPVPPITAIVGLFCIESRCVYGKEAIQDMVLCLGRQYLYGRPW